MSKIAEHVARLPTGPIYYHRAGNSGTPVVLLHGGGTDTARISWEKTIPTLASGYRVYAPDWPKHGGSQPFCGTVTQEALERCLGELMDAWKLSRATLVGLSMGGSVATGFALKHPGRVERLVMVDSGGLQERSSMHKLGYVLLRTPYLPRLTARLFARRSLVRHSLKKRLFKSPVEDLEEITDAVYEEVKARSTVYSDWQLDELRWKGLKTNHMPRLHQIQHPALIVHGTEDDLVPLACAREAARRMPNAELYEMEGCGHWPNRERPAEFNEALVGFLRRADESAG